MKRFKALLAKFTIVGALTMVWFSAGADSWLVSSAAVNHVVAVMPMSQGYVLSQMDRPGLVTGGGTCTSGGYSFYLGVGGGGITSIDTMKLITATALQALATGAKVMVYYDDSTNSCWIKQMGIVAS